MILLLSVILAASTAQAIKINTPRYKKSCQTSILNGDSLTRCILIDSKNGDTSRIESFRNGRRDGIFLDRAENGQIQSLWHYKDGLRIDTNYFWNDNGKLMDLKVCDHEGNNCTQYLYDSAGNVRAIGKLYRGVYRDTFREWYPNKHLKEMELYGSRGDTDRTIIRWNPAGFMTDSMIFADRNEIEAFSYFGNGKLEDHRTWKVRESRPRIWSIEQYDSATGNVVGTVKDGNGLVLETTIGGKQALFHYVDGINQNDLSDEQLMALMSGKDVPAQKFDRYPDGSLRCMYMDLGGRIGMMYAVCYTHEGKKTSEVLKGNGTLIVPHSDGKGSEKRVFRKGKEVVPRK